MKRKHGNYVKLNQRIVVDNTLKIGILQLIFKRMDNNY